MTNTAQTSGATSRTSVPTHGRATPAARRAATSNPMISAPRKTM